MKNSAIYGIQNTINGKWYIGQTLNMALRKKYHFSQLRRRSHHNPHLQAAFNRYGEKNFSFVLVEEIKEDLLDSREVAWIEYFDSMNRKYGYNLEDGGHINKHMSEETKQKISKSHSGSNHYNYGKHLSASHKKNLSVALKDRKFSIETRQKISNAKKGFRHSIKSIKKMSKSHSGHFVSKATRKKMSIVHGVKNLSLETRRKISEANKSHGISKATRRKMADSNTGHIVSQKTRQKISKSLKKYYFHSDK